MLFFLAAFTITNIFGQSGNIVISSDTGNIIVFIKGMKQNIIADENVEITAIKDSSLSFSVIVPALGSDSIRGNVKVKADRKLTYKMSKTNGIWNFILYADEPLIGIYNGPINIVPPGGQIESTSTSVTKPNNTGIAPESITK